MNKKPARVFRNGQFITIQTRKIVVGDILILKGNEEISADSIILASSDRDGIAYVNTMNLDGETNLKIKRTPLQIMKQIGQIPLIQKKEVIKDINENTTNNKHITRIEQQEDENDGQLIIDEENLSSQLAKLNGTIKCQFPNKNLHNFIGQLRSSIDSVSLSIVEIGLGEQELLLKGSSLRSTAYSLGCVVYTGKESKELQLPIKCAGGRHLLEESIMPEKKLSKSDIAAEKEAQKQYEEQRMKKKGTSVALLKELQALDIIFTGRTADQIFLKIGPNQKQIKIQILSSLSFTSDRGRMSVIVRLPYEYGKSEDEIENEQTRDNKDEYETESENEFEQTQSLNSGSTQNENQFRRGQIRLYSKGADNILLPMCITSRDLIEQRIQKAMLEWDRIHSSFNNMDNKQYQGILNKSRQLYEIEIRKQFNKQSDVHSSVCRDIRDFSQTGLRTLAITTCEISESQFNDWFSRYYLPAELHEEKLIKLDQCFKILEMGNLELIGCTGVEDILQEKCAETMNFFRQEIKWRLQLVLVDRVAQLETMQKAKKLQKKRINKF
ncbi:MAG: putative phospholipid-transporting ATPase IA [Streblomastix strix]|uniref:Putative phospholipid-transporting ATPase IA n=1 Tax=Streblomastix strix TaxID=222440 RepID=A0A5J4W6P3_9EUKA|nr:MAG: putative phospholipid-transporting ATPase IA [Streblomastix strix]